jgi:hypothetical protein
MLIEHRWLYTTVALVAMLAASPAAVQAINHYDAGLLRARSMLNQYNSLLGRPLPPLHFEDREAVLYYAIALEFDGQPNLLRPMLGWQDP